jgi:uncharacterized lipoprotein YddW (UPF0748 family)
MKRIILLIFMLPVFVFAQPNQEFRATWVVDFNWLQPGMSVEQSKALIREVLDDHVRANMTSVLWQVRRFGTVYYPSAYEPWGPQTNFSNPGFDPLAYAVEQAHARGLEIHAWFNTFESRFAYAGSPSNLHPEWICRDQDGIPMPTEIAWLSPGIPAVREYLRNVALEIVNNYDVDGLHLDFVRWNEHSNSGKSLELARKQFQMVQKGELPDGLILPEQYQEMSKNNAGRYLYDQFTPFSGGIPSGFSSWEEYWRWSVTQLVQSIQDSIKSVKPWVRLSPAALGRYNWGGWQGYGSVYQDAALWLNEGYIDQITGMHYHWSNAADIYDVLEGGCPNCWSDYIQPAIQAGRMYSVGLFSDNFSNNGLFGRHKSIIDTVRSVSWADGVQFFSYASWRDQDYWDTAKNLFFQRKAKIRATGLIHNVPPGSPTMAFQKLDSLHYQLSVSPPSTTEKMWFAVYRSEDNLLQPDQDEILKIAFGDTGFVYVDAFDGLQDYNGTYWYFATALDRYWNESAASNAFESDSIPSFAPTVVSTTPAEGDTIPVSENITVKFSKTMIPGTVESAVTFNLPVVVSQYEWTSDHKQLTIHIAGDLQFDTQYEMRIVSSATDINGKALDGNGDGIPGDDFVLHFHTLSQDIVGPKVIAAYPNLQGTETDFEIGDIINIIFDEHINHFSVADSEMVLKTGDTTVPFDYLISDNDEFSMISIQPEEPLQPNTAYRLLLHTASMTDTLGNVFLDTLTLSFSTAGFIYSETMMVENFTFPGDWWQPTGSGSTVGVIANRTNWGYNSQIVLPVPRPRKAAFLNYAWDTSASSHLIREYLSGGAPRDILFDTTYVLQCYVYGDGSATAFRFAIDDNAPNGGSTNHEVSVWKTIDWNGWRLVSWDLAKDPVGTWLGDGILQGALRFDSFQLTYDPGVSATSGRLYFDDLRLVKKQTAVVGLDQQPIQLPKTVTLYQNYPNPFNPTTTIAYDVSSHQRVELKIYDMLGRVVKTLVNAYQEPGRYHVTIDASEFSSGTYFYQLKAGNMIQTRKMLLIK